MKRSHLALLWLMVGGCVWGYPEYRAGPPAAPPVTLDAVVRLGKAGVSDDLIIEKLLTDGIASRPTPTQIVALKRDGVSDRVLEAVAQARVPVAEEISTGPWVVYPDYFIPDPWWTFGPWWCAWWWWHPHGYVHGWHGGWRH